MLKKQYTVPGILAAIVVLSLGLHGYLTTTLNVVEDESAYLMDAWQMNFHVLPFREFGATKGPVFLVLLKSWQILTGQTVEAGRLFTSLLHVASIPLLYLLTFRLTKSHAAALLAAAFWGLTPAAVSLTSNVIHIPLELVFILAALVTLTFRDPPTKTWQGILAALFYFLAMLTRATAIGFFPVMIVTIIFFARSWKLFLAFCATGAILLGLTVAIIYPLYGWPKTAFFFNADALLITQDQQRVYHTSQTSSAMLLFQGLLPVWYEGLPTILLALAWPFLLIPATTKYLRIMLAAVLLLGAYALSPILLPALAEHWSRSLGLSTLQVNMFAWSSFITLTAITLLLLSKKVSNSSFWPVATVITVWVAGIVGFYYFWGREPTPFYVTEIIPALAIAASLALVNMFQRGRILAVAAVLLAAVTSLFVYLRLLDFQYRGTVALAAARQAGETIANIVPTGEAIFTAQPVYPFLGHRPLYRYLTHPGWYLAERAGIVPTSIRRVFFPDSTDLAKAVSQNVNWIVTDWRTNDVYFKEGVAETQDFRDILAKEFAPVAEIPNDVTQPIILYHRTK